MEGVTIITDARVVTCAPRAQNGRLSIVIRNGRIADLSPNGRLLLSLYPGAQTVDASNKLVIPGFVNAHFHSESLLLREITDGRHISLWGQDVRIQERLARLVDTAHDDDLRAVYLMAYFNHLRCGTTCVGEFPPMVDGKGLSTLLQATKRTDVKSVVALQSWDQINEARNIPADRQKFSLSVGPETDFTVYTFQSLTRTAKEFNLPLIAHVAEQKEDIETVRRNFQKGTVGLLRDFKVLQPPTVLVHLNHVAEEEMALVAESGCALVLSPRSAAMKRTGYPSLRRMPSRDIPLAIGTDWGAQDMLEEMRFIRQLPLLFAGMPEFTPLEILSMATTGGADALGMSDEIGSIAQGKKADMVFFDLGGLHGDILDDHPSAEAMASFLLNHLSSRDISDVMIDGKFCVSEGHIVTMPEEDILAGYRKTAEKFSLIGATPPASIGTPKPQPEMHAKIIPFVPADRTAHEADGFEEGFSAVQKPPEPKEPPAPTPKPVSPPSRTQERNVLKPELSKNVRKVFGEDDEPSE
jgi:5-methylthioadenosine/S-adenosylhomocysteine deaminase